MNLATQSYMPPPWLAYPEYERYSLGWRMGSGEDYLDRFAAWFEALGEKEREIYRARFPEPFTWAGWWDDEDKASYLERGDFCIAIRNPDGAPKYTRALLGKQKLAGKKQKYCFFWGHQPAKDGSVTKSAFSQWWKADFYGTGERFSSAEQYMMAEKAALFCDAEHRAEILSVRDPKRIKALGREVRGFEEAIWQRFRYAIVLNGSWLKFSQNRELRDFLLSTGDKILVEASPYDRVWGIGLTEHEEAAENPLKWKGENLLGFALTEVREELRRVTAQEALCDFKLV